MQEKFDKYKQDMQNMAHHVMDDAEDLGYKALDGMEELGHKAMEIGRASCRERVSSPV